MWYSDKWKDYALLDCGDGTRLENWGGHILIRPDPQAIWTPSLPQKEWQSASARYIRSSSGGGRWEIKNLPQKWSVSYGKLKFNIKPMNFKHTGVFPEQAANWDFIHEKITKAERKISVLNLFAYTGGATLAAAAAGADVCHVDAAKNMVAAAKENARLSGLGEAKIRYIVDDCKKFVEREIRRGRKYDAIIMDPPSYGRGPSGEIWRYEEDIFGFVELTAKLLSDNPLFFILNSYTTGISPAASGYIVSRLLCARYGGNVDCGELGIPVKSSGLLLPAGACARWHKC